MADSRLRNSSAGMTTILMIAALVLIAALFFWLSMEATPTQIAVVEDDSTAVDGGTEDSSAADVTLAEFATGPAGYQSLNVRLREVGVAARLAERGFWIQLPNNQPYLVHIGDALASGGTAVASGDTVTVSGVIRLMSDSVLNAWRSTGVLTDDLQVEEARFATSFMDAQALN